MKHSEFLEKCVKLQRKLDAKGYEAKVRASYHSYDSVYASIVTKKCDLYFASEFPSFEEIEDKIKLSMIPTYIKLKGVCVDKLGTTVYLLENDEYKPRILQGLTADGVILDNNEIFDIDLIYVEE